MPLRRRRDGAAVQARTEEQSSARVRVPLRQKAPRSLSTVLPFAGRHPRGASAGATRRRGTPGLTPIEPVTRVPGASRGGHARHRPRARGSPFLERFGPRSVPSTQVEHVVRKPARADRGSQAPDAATHRRANATGIGWCRRVAGRKLHSRARIERSSGVPARRYQVAEVGKRRRGPEKRVSRWQRGAWTGSLASERSARARGGEKASRTGIAVAKPRSQGKSGAGRSKGRCGAKVLARWKASRVTRPARIVHASGLAAVLAALTEAQARASGMTTGGRGDRGVRGAVRTRHDGKTTPTAATPATGTCGPPKRIALT